MTKESLSPKMADDSDEYFWTDKNTTIVREEPGAKPVYDLEERTARFGEAIIDFAKKIPTGPLIDRIISQLVGAGTSVGANYDEADDAVSKKGISKVHWNMQERSTGERALLTQGGSRCS